MTRSAGSNMGESWTRRRFLGAAVSAAGLAAAGAATAPPDAQDAAGQAPDAPPGSPPDLPIHGSPYLAASGLPPGVPLPPVFAGRASHPGAPRLIHFHVADDLRDRLFLGLP